MVVSLVSLCLPAAKARSCPDKPYVLCSMGMSEEAGQVHERGECSGLASLVLFDGSAVSKEVVSTEWAAHTQPPPPPGSCFPVVQCRDKHGAWPLLEGCMSLLPPLVPQILGCPTSDSGEGGSLLLFSLKLSLTSVVMVFLVVCFSSE